VTVANSRDANRERQFHSARDFETSSSQIGEVEPFSDQLRRKAQLIIAGNAKGRSKKAKVADAEEMMRMLGVHPDQPSLADPLVGPTPTFQLRHGGHHS
jgi:hypothetical protein